MYDYLNRENLENIENDLSYLTEMISQKVNFYDEIESIKNVNDKWVYQKNTWIKGQPVWLENIDNIEKTIEFLSLYFYRENDWVDNKKWIEDGIVKKRNISYGDVFRWEKDISLLKDNIDKDIYLYNSKDQKFEWGKKLPIKWRDY